MAFISSDGTQHGTTQAPPRRPILTSTCNLIGSIEIAVGILGTIFALQNPHYGVATAAGIFAASIFSALVIFGLGQAVSFLARSADASERAARAAERTATLAERNELRTTAAP